MPRKTAAQKARAASSSSTNNPESIQHGPDTTEDHPRRKRSKKSHTSMTEPDESSPKPNNEITTQDGTTTKETGRQPGHTRPAPPPVPASVTTSTVILPREADDPKLRAQHEIRGINVTPNAKMEPKIQQVLAALRATENHARSTVVALTAPARAANKCVGVAEIATRELVKASKVFQYTGCWTRLETQEPSRKAGERTLPEDEERHDRSADMEEEGAPEVEDDSDDAFEESGVAERKKVRDNVCLVIYLSLKHVARLHELYGEQTHALDKG